METGQRQVGAAGDAEIKRFGALPSAIGTITRLACAQAKAAGVDVGPLLQKAGITQQQIDDPSVRLNVRDQIRFVNLAASALQDDFLGFHIAQLSDLRELGLLYYVAASSETLSQALQQAARYASIVNEGVSLKYVNDDDGVGMVFRYVGVSRHLDRHQMEFIATILVRIAGTSRASTSCQRERDLLTTAIRSVLTSLNSSAATLNLTHPSMILHLLHRSSTCRSSMRTLISTGSWSNIVKRPCRASRRTSGLSGQPSRMPS